MSLLEDIKYVPLATPSRKFKKTTRKIVANESQLDFLAKSLQLKDWQIHLVRLIDINRQNMSYLSRCLKCDRQYIWQEYDRIYAKAVELKQSKLQSSA